MKRFLYLIVSVFIIIIFSVDYVSNNKKKIYEYIKNNYPPEYLAFLKFINKPKENTKKLSNDYNVNFLPQTQSLELSFKKIKIDISPKSLGYVKGLKGWKYVFFISEFEDKIILISSVGEIKLISMKDIDNENFLIKDIKNSLLEKSNIIEIRDSLVIKDKIYLSVSEQISDKCKLLKIYETDLNNLDYLDFNVANFYKECSPSIFAGKMQPWIENGEDRILITMSGQIVKGEDERDDKPQDDNSIYGKIISFDQKNNSYEIFSKGHRNSLGLFVDSKNKIILSTENGPRGGDEINLIKKFGNYGWNISSYGEYYYSDNVYKKSHENYGFVEPIFTFIPSIGISEIIKLDNNFSSKWQNNFLVGSLNSRHLYRVKFDNAFSKLLFHEDIFVGERIRDILYSRENKLIFLALEDTGSIGILKTK
jgi:hypothetical protein